MVKESQFNITKHLMMEVNKGNSGLEQKEYTVLLHLTMHRNSKTGLCFPSVETLANECHMGDRTVKEAVKGLKAKGWITYKRGGIVQGKPVSNLYTIDINRILSTKSAVKDRSKPIVVECTDDTDIPPTIHFHDDMSVYVDNNNEEF